MSNINELLRTALLKASDPGEGDEEPEILPACGGFETNGISEERRRSIKREQEEEILFNKQQAIMEEERKVAEMKFDSDIYNIPTSGLDRMVERAKYIPLRLTYEERKALRLVCSATSISNYTDAVDQQFKSKIKRQHVMLQYIVSFLSGIITSNNYDEGRSVIENRNFIDYQKQIRNHLEIARRYKITNPEKMRSEYGKLVYLIQDAGKHILSIYAYVYMWNI